METGRFRDLNYIVRTPHLKKETYPAILFLHGSGTRGSDVSLLKKNPFFSQNSCICKSDSPFIVFAPQCHRDTWFDLFEQLRAFVSFIRSDPRVDSQRTYLIGTSMGGYAAWQLAMSMPDSFAGVVPICGGGMRWNVKRIVHLPIWAFHGKDDQSVPPEESIHMVEAIHRAGGNARLTLLDHMAHNVWDYAYGHQALFDWLLLQHQDGASITESTEFADAARFG